MDTYTQPNIAFVENGLSHFKGSRSQVHRIAAKRVLKYLAGARDYG